MAFSIFAGCDQRLDGVGLALNKVVVVLTTDRLKHLVDVGEL